jgi:predicted nucleotide-binding protein
MVRNDDEIEYDDDVEDIRHFTVFISHGRSHLWKDVARFIEKRLEIDTVILKDQINKGRTIIEKLEEEADDCDYAIIIMTAEDEMADGSLRARQNIVHEIGFFQGKYGRNKVLVLSQDKIEEFSNIAGIVYESFIGDNIQSTFERIRNELEEAEEEYNEQFQEDDDEDE